MAKNARDVPYRRLFRIFSKLLAHRRVYKCDSLHCDSCLFSVVWNTSKTKHQKNHPLFSHFLRALFFLWRTVSFGTWFSGYPYGLLNFRESQWKESRVWDVLDIRGLKEARAACGKKIRPLLISQSPMYRQFSWRTVVRRTNLVPGKSPLLAYHKSKICLLSHYMQ